MRRTTQILILVVVLVLTGCAGTTGPAGPSPTTGARTLLMPNVVGQNADVARDALHKLGFDNVDLGTVDGRRIVVLPQNWTVRIQSAKPGTRLTPDTKIVLGCARIGSSRWPVLATATPPTTATRS